MLTISKINHIWNLTPELLFKWSIINAVAGKTAIDPQGYPLLAITPQIFLIRPICLLESDVPGMIIFSGFTSAVELDCWASLFICLPSSSLLFPVPSSCWMQTRPASLELYLSSFPAMLCLYNELISYCVWTNVVLFNSKKDIYLKICLNLMTS